jgi:outer membrane protein OmpA-like peptidoglycan-associated protein
VKEYLVARGIEESRITTIGYGPDKPIMENTSRKGRSHNRRIEFRLLPGSEGRAPAQPAMPSEP